MQLWDSNRWWDSNRCEHLSGTGRPGQYRGRITHRHVHSPVRRTAIRHSSFCLLWTFPFVFQHTSCPCIQYATPSSDPAITQSPSYHHGTKYTHNQMSTDIKLTSSHRYSPRLAFLGLLSLEWSMLISATLISLRSFLFASWWPASSRHLVWSSSSASWTWNIA